MTVVAITGVTGDVGYAAAKMLAAATEIDKLVITCRTKEKAEAVISRLVSDTGKSASFFSYVVVDLNDYASVTAAIKAFPSVDRLCLNAGGLGWNAINAQTGLTETVMNNVLGNTVLSDGLVKAGKIKKGGRIVYIGTEITRTIWGFTGFAPIYFSFSESDIEHAMTQNYDADCGPLQSCCCPPIRNQLGDYKNAKIIAQAYYAAFAEEEPGVHVISSSPGGVGGSFANVSYFPMKQLMAYVPWIFNLSQLTHSMEAGVQRYVDVLTGPPAWETGSMPMSGKSGCPCLWGAKGPMADNREYASYLNDPKLNKAVLAKVREYQAKWATIKPETMERMAPKDML